MSQNRKQRRAAAAAVKRDQEPNNFEIPLARPPTGSHNTKKQNGEKTLLELAAERQAGFATPRVTTNKSTKKGERKNGSSDEAKLFDMDATETQFIQISPDGEVSQFTPEDPTTQKDGKEEEEEGNGELPPIIDTLLLSMPLTTLHFTLAFLAAHQYAQTIHFKELAYESMAIAFPVLTFCIHVAHGHVLTLTRKKPSPKKSRVRADSVWDLIFGKPSLKAFFFLALAIFLGGFLIKLTNEEGYYAVMKRAPSIGTMWVWCVLEMAPGVAVVGVLVPLGWGVGYMGYQIA
ncbi:hypothetical protein BGW36DRAFT_380392 [Talaromyces proteolyticus]|uniref:DUF7719 domain-containing protein n=1 Tax=Talaromyces proteolyticus TaxID=1131652 RepID=A0AAD4KPI4_9EURO|nr:uncharacterized protein BGW36DRAFT_380392 [Talaromyces proteolyticus]KAH8696183.1 hypothetical protein BGW36DRAFT_380392 [Talaromyces proteolyticus]